MGMVREGIVQYILEIVLWRMIKLRRFLINNTSHFIVLLIKMMAWSNWNVRRELAIEAPEYFALDFSVFASVVLYVKKSVDSFFPLFLRCFILLLIPNLALLKYTVKWEPDHECYVLSNIIKMAEIVFFFLQILEYMFLHGENC